ncbi:Bgt-133 [Blumeria graminis f. sp. tritici]|uniref:Protein transport protein SEC31 n=2 Tax=Blumeria graminis f. sp. tritici TaxID=62690 RepID=A0A061HDE3_BLUGR|nr:phosphoprotein component of the COPII coat of secretory pathway vesicles [Blumeria graminis f. sp. tritici 96224]VCU39663.1 Bgt-133 [Blumeria graminis f. sp. tritici]
MVRLRTIGRTGAFAWNPDSGLPLLVTGTRAGAVDVDFSDETKLELWDLSLDDPGQAVELVPISSCSIDSRFHDLAWSPPNANHPRGIIAGALENGSLYLWDAKKFINREDDSIISKSRKHSGPIKSLQFNPLKPQILATAGTKGELFVYDIDDMDNPFRLGTTVARSDDLECIAWNRKVPHILATGGSGGIVTVWDLKTKKASLSLNNNRKAVGAIAWDPENATKLITATPDDSCPVILLWDLRNSNAPECTLKGHNQGVLSISWCQQDSKLLLSCGKDNRTLLWNPQNGQLLGEFPEVTNWTFQTRFHPHNPALSATASFDGKISVQTLQNTNPIAIQPQSQSAVDGEDFFTKVQTQPQGASFSLKEAPKWLQRPSGVTFGFGGKLVKFGLQSAATDRQMSSKIQISLQSPDSSIASLIQTFEGELRKGDLKAICQDRISHENPEKEDSSWKVIESLLNENPRKQIIEYLGFSDVGKETGIIGDIDEKEKKEKTDNTKSGATESSSRLSTLFADGTDGEDFLSNISATKGAKMDSPFNILSETDSELEKNITKALILGDFEKAMTLCFKEDRIADALIIANCGGKELLERAQSLYLSKKKNCPNYLRLLTSVIGKNLWDIVYNANLENWKEAMVTICTYADSTEFSDLCESLGDRIMEKNAHKDASFCYLVGSRLEKVIPIWLAEIEDSNKAKVEEMNGDSLFSIHACSLQTFIEKVTVFREISKFTDVEQTLPSGWKLAPLYDKYVEYADIVAANGQLETAVRYLSLLPTSYPSVEIARKRVKHSPTGAMSESKVVEPNTKVASSQPLPQTTRNYRTNPTRYRDPARTQPTDYQNQPILLEQENRLVDQNSQKSNFQQQNGSNMSTQQDLNYPPQSFNAPPRSTIPSAPPPNAKEVGQWNDTPMVVKPSLNRKPTSSYIPAAASYPNQQQQQQHMFMPPSAPFYGNEVSATPLPPPKGMAPNRMNSPSTNVAQQNLQRPSSAASQYAPQAVPSLAGPYVPQAVTHNQQFGQPPINQLGGPHYQSSLAGAPPSGPPNNRYAPIPATQHYSRPPAAQVIMDSSKSGNTAPLNNKYAPVQNIPQAQFSSTMPPYNSTQSLGHPNVEPAVLQAQIQPQSQIVPSAATSASSSLQSAAKVRHPPGDRTHIPPSAQRMVEVLTNEMQRVAAQAPSSFAPQVKDTQKRLNILFDHLNNEETVKPDTILRLNKLTEALVSKNYDVAGRIQIEIQTEKTDECGNWMVGVKRLISMSKVTP